MKQEDFIVGKWYKSQFNNYFKFKEFKNGYSYFSEEIYNKKWGKREARGNWGFVEIDILEIQEYLPEDHPDLLLASKEDYDYLIEFLNKLGIN